MILRPVEPPPAAPEHADPAQPLDAYAVVERAQKQRGLSAFCLIPQPLHSALAGDLAAALRPDLYGPLAPELTRAIALHDAGWGQIDAEQIQDLRDAEMRSKSHVPLQPTTFIDLPVRGYLRAWKQSIDIAARQSAAGGILVSRHFSRLARQGGERNEGRREHEQFLQSERERQAVLLPQQSCSDAQLESYTDALQFCDLLSLFLCVDGPRHGGARFPRRRPAEGGRGESIALAVHDGRLHADPPIFDSPRTFTVPALRFPVRNGAPGQESFAYAFDGS